MKHTQMDHERLLLLTAGDLFIIDTIYREYTTHHYKTGETKQNKQK